MLLSCAGYAAEMVLALLLGSSGNISTNAVAVTAAALSAGSNPGFLSLSRVVAWMVVRGASCTILRSSPANPRSVSVIVVGAGA